MNLSPKQEQTHRCRKQTYGYQRRQGVRDKLGAWDRQIHGTVCKVNSEILLCIGVGIIFSVL